VTKYIPNNKDRLVQLVMCYCHQRKTWFVLCIVKCRLHRQRHNIIQVASTLQQLTWITNIIQI